MLRRHEWRIESLVSQQVDELLLAGRCISVDHHADVSTRNQDACKATGHAVGTAAAMASQRSLSPRRVDAAALQETLRA